VGAEPSATNPLGVTRKYGMAVPSFEVASCWLTSMPAASKNAGSDLTFSGGLAPCTSQSDDGERKSV
jgi:hypothetical protein